VLVSHKIVLCHCPLLQCPAPFFSYSFNVHSCIFSPPTAAHRRTCRTTAFRPPVSTLGSTCVPPTVNYLLYPATGLTLTAVGPFQLPASTVWNFLSLSLSLSLSLPDFLWDPTISSDCFRRLLKTYLFARY